MPGRRPLPRLGAGRPVALDFDFTGTAAHCMSVVPCLHAQQRFHVHAECLLDPQRHFRRKRRIAVYKIGNSGAAHTEYIRCLAHAQVQFVGNFITDELARMRRLMPIFIGALLITATGRAGLR